MMPLIGYLLFIHALTYFLYWQDKRASRSGGWRVSEFALLMAGFLGGTLAALLAQRMLRHKTRKASFQFKFWALTLVQLGLALFPPPLLGKVASRLFG
jgi:uncharacterized membrane protein YsdA (DUF1294 family)